MNWLKKLTAFTLLLAMTTSCSSSADKPTLHIFTWAEVFKPELIDAFEKQCDCNVVIDTFDSNESMYAKLQLSSADYDIIMPSNYFVEVLANQGMIQKIDKAKVPNSRKFDPAYFSQDKPAMALPYLMSFSGIAYRKDKLQNIDPSWSVFGRADLKGRMTMLNDIREALGAALRYQGHSINTTDKKAINDAADVLISWKNNLAKFDNEQYRHGIASGEFLVVQGYSIDIMQVREENENVAFLYPKEGAIVSVDSFAIPKNAKSLDLAYAFIDFMLEDKNAVTNALFTNGLIPLKTIYPELKKDPVRSEILFPSQQALEKLELIRDLGPDIQLYYDAWERVKTS